MNAYLEDQEEGQAEAETREQHPHGMGEECF